MGNYGDVKWLEGLMICANFLFSLIYSYSLYLFLNLALFFSLLFSALVKYLLLCGDSSSI